jgi:hypothetical protein
MRGRATDPASERQNQLLGIRRPHAPWLVRFPSPSSGPPGHLPPAGGKAGESTRAPVWVWVTNGKLAHLD